MKIAITSEGETLDSQLDRRFGRARGFVLHDTESGETSYIGNIQNLNAMQGAGIQSSKTIIDAGAEVLITGNVGPKAFATLHSAGIDIYIGAEGTVQDGIDAYKSGKLEKAESANVEGHW